MVSDAVGFGVKAQPGLDFSLSVALPFGDLVGPGIGIVMTNQWPSSAAAGFSIRGYSELGASVFVLGQLKVASVKSLGDIRAGGTIGMTASMAQYSDTTLAFFVPSLDASAFVSLRPARGLWECALSVPFRLLLRKDMGYALSVGLSATATYVLSYPAART